MSLLSKSARLPRLSGAEVRLLLQGYVLLHLAALGLRLFPFRQWAAMFVGSSRRRFAAGGEEDPRRLRQAERTAALVQAAATFALVPVRCLERSLVLARLLRQQRLGGRLRFGVRNEGRAIQAHAWVEFGSQALGEPAGVADTYLPLELPGDLLPDGTPTSRSCFIS